MNEQQQPSQIAHESIPNFHSSQPPNPKYTTYTDIKHLQSLPSPSHQPQNCKPTYLSWQSNTSQLPPNIKISPYNNQEWIIDENLGLCCLVMRLEVKFKLKRNTNIQIGRYRVTGGVYEEEGVRYVVENKVTTLGVKICIVKDRQLKIWKQIQTPILSYQPETTNTVSITEHPNGDITLTLNNFQFMLNLNIAAMRVPSLRLMLRAQHNIDSILLEQTVEKKDGDGDGGGGCGDGGCKIF